MTDLTFSEYERIAKQTDVADKGEQGLTIPLLGLAGEVGSLLTEHKKRLREGDRYKVFTDKAAEEMGDILWYLSSIATKSGLSLAEIAEENLAKLKTDPPLGTVRDKGIGGSRRPRRFDDQLPVTERLPRKLRVQFREVPDGSGFRLEISRNGKVLGRPLTDNSYYRDGYRYHDVFHLSNAIMLGWSPVTRKLLGVKRRSNPETDEIEDGGRASVVEEGIAALVFAHAAEHSFFKGSSDVDYELLRTIKLMTGPFEVRARSAWEWERTILMSFSVWRSIKERHGGVFVGDADAGTILFEAIPMKRRRRGSRLLVPLQRTSRRKRSDRH